MTIIVDKSKIVCYNWGYSKLIFVKSKTDTTETGAFSGMDAVKCFFYNNKHKFN